MGCGASAPDEQLHLQFSKELDSTRPDQPLKDKPSSIQPESTTTPFYKAPAPEPVPKYKSPPLPMSTRRMPDIPFTTINQMPSALPIAKEMIKGDPCFEEQSPRVNKPIGGGNTIRAYFDRSTFGSKMFTSPHLTSDETFETFEVKAPVNNPMIVSPKPEGKQSPRVKAIHESKHTDGSSQKSRNTPLQCKKQGMPTVAKIKGKSQDKERPNLEQGKAQNDRVSATEGTNLSKTLAKASKSGGEKTKASIHNTTNGKTVLENSKAKKANCKGSKKSENSTSPTSNWPKPDLSSKAAKECIDVSAYFRTISLNPGPTNVKEANSRMQDEESLQSSKRVNLPIETNANKKIIPCDKIEMRENTSKSVSVTPNTVSKELSQKVKKATSESFNDLRSREGQSKTALCGQSANTHKNSSPKVTSRKPSRSMSKSHSKKPASVKSTSSKSSRKSRQAKPQRKASTEKSLVPSTSSKLNSDQSRSSNVAPRNESSSKDQQRYSANLKPTEVAPARNVSQERVSASKTEELPTTSNGDQSSKAKFPANQMESVSPGLVKELRISVKPPVSDVYSGVGKSTLISTRTADLPKAEQSQQDNEGVKQSVDSKSKATEQPFAQSTAVTCTAASESLSVAFFKPKIEAKSEGSIASPKPKANGGSSSSNKNSS